LGLLSLHSLIKSFLKLSILLSNLLLLNNRGGFTILHVKNSVIV
jgi:hypothetical protein